MKNFINIADINKQDLRKIIDQAKLQKNKRSNIVYSGPILNSMIYYYLLLTVLEKFYTIIFKWAFNQF